MATESLLLTLPHAEWAAFVHAAFERERKRQDRTAAENRLAAAEHSWWTTPTERAEAAAEYVRTCTRA